MERRGLAMVTALLAWQYTNTTELHLDDRTGFELLPHNLAKLSVRHIGPAHDHVPVVVGPRLSTHGVLFAAGASACHWCGSRVPHGVVCIGLQRLAFRG